MREERDKWTYHKRVLAAIISNCYDFKSIRVRRPDARRKPFFSNFYKYWSFLSKLPKHSVGTFFTLGFGKFDHFIQHPVNTPILPIIIQQPAQTEQIQRSRSDQITLIWQTWGARSRTGPIGSHLPLKIWPNSFTFFAQADSNYTCLAWESDRILLQVRNDCRERPRRSPPESKTASFLGAFVFSVSL